MNENEKIELTKGELLHLLKEAYRNGFATYEMVEAGLEPYDSDGYARWVLLGLKIAEQKKLVEQLIKVSNEISKIRTPSANYIHLSEEYIRQQADARKISFTDMVEIIKKELMPNK